MSVRVMKYAFVCLLIIAMTMIANGTRSVLIDCGSSGSRVYVYEFVPKYALETVSEVAHKRSSHALSSFVDDLPSLRTEFELLIDFAKTHVSPARWHNTSITMMATGGLRDLSIVKQNLLVDAVKNVLSTSGFKFQENDTRVISGQEEALFDLLGVMATLKSHSIGSEFAAADLGGASMQLAYAYPSTNRVLSFINPEDLSTSPCYPDYRLDIPHYGSFDVVAKSFHQRGLIAATVNAFFSMHQSSDHLHSLESKLTTNSMLALNDSIDKAMKVEHDEILSCFSPSLPSSSDIDGNFTNTAPDQRFHIHGTGDFSLCVQVLKDRLLPMMQEAVDFRCLRSKLPHAVIGIDNFPKVLQMLSIEDHIAVSPRQIAERGTEICQTPWETLFAQFPDFPTYRAQRACFGGSYIYLILTEIYGISMDEDSRFLPMNLMGTQELSWAAGAAVFHAMNLTAQEWQPEIFEVATEELVGDAPIELTEAEESSDEL